MRHLARTAAAAELAAPVTLEAWLACISSSPVIAAFLASNPNWQQAIDRPAPANARLTIQHTTNLHSLAITPWACLGLLAARAARRAPRRRADPPRLRDT